MKNAAQDYQQFDADFGRDVPAEGYGGWRTAEIELTPERTALVIMHAWDTGTRERYPGWHRAVEYFQRADAILKTLFPPLLAAVHASRPRLNHVTSGSYYCRDFPGYRRAAALAGPAPELPNRAVPDPVSGRLREFKQAHAFAGTHSLEDVGRGFQALRFPREAEPRGTRASRPGRRPGGSWPRRSPYGASRWPSVSCSTRRASYGACPPAAPPPRIPPR